MIKTVSASRMGGKIRSDRHPVRVTALWYLKDALLKERYETCSEILSVAREFGATEGEIQGLLEDPRRSPG
ncbi:MAG: hypothetical protein MOGMAGMI_00638 [Candidatus Omnitrophica bacterium]|nr:hypothetical protein [Candidatus Omnitrophota bacterium]